MKSTGKNRINHSVFRRYFAFLLLASPNFKAQSPDLKNYYRFFTAKLPYRSIRYELYRYIQYRYVKLVLYKLIKT